MKSTNPSTDQIVQWLKIHELINIHGLNRVSGLPNSKLKEVKNKTQKLSENQVTQLLPHLEEYGYNHWLPLTEETPPETGQLVVIRFQNAYNEERWEIGKWPPVPHLNKSFQFKPGEIKAFYTKFMA